MNFPERIKYVSALLLAGFIYPACADNWYQVEVIIFEHLHPDVDGELWLKNPGMPDYSNVVELFGEHEIAVLDGAGAASIENEPVAFLPLTKEKFRLQGIYRVLRSSRDYRPLQHISWQQPALKTRAAKAVHLSLYEQTESLIKDLPPEREELEKPGEAIFNGFVRVRSSLFLHVDIDINYFPEIPEKNKNDGILETDENIEETGEQEIEYVRLKESRKIKLNEIHYFDHPMFGVIVQVSRLESEDARQSNE